MYKILVETWAGGADGIASLIVTFDTIDEAEIAIKQLNRSNKNIIRYVTPLYTQGA